MFSFLFNRRDLADFSFFLVTREDLLLKKNSFDNSAKKIFDKRINFIIFYTVILRFCLIY